MSLRSIFAAVTASFPVAVLAVPVTITFSGTVQSVQAGTPYPAIGTTVSGTFVFDDDPAHYTSGSFPIEGPGYAFYEYNGAPYGLSLTLADRTIDTSYGGVEVFDNGSLTSPLDAPTDTMRFSTKKSNVSYSLRMSGPNDSFAGSALPSLSTLATFWHTAQLVVRDLNISFGQPTLTAGISSVSISAVPEPSTGALMLTGLAAAAFCLRRHSTRQRTM